MCEPKIYDDIAFKLQKIAVYEEKYSIVSSLHS
jgi:hypothetical protein